MWCDFYRITSCHMICCSELLVSHNHWHYTLRKCLLRSNTRFKSQCSMVFFSALNFVFFSPRYLFTSPLMNRFLFDQLMFSCDFITACCFYFYWLDMIGFWYYCSWHHFTVRYKHHHWFVWYWLQFHTFIGTLFCLRWASLQKIKSLMKGIFFPLKKFFYCFYQNSNPLRICTVQELKSVLKISSCHKTDLKLNWN